jgi:multiple sugar transport system ATP-binding protein
MAEIVLKDITKRFGKLIAVNKLDLTIKDKEFLVLLGPSGCGKTTTLRSISGLEFPDEGRIYIGGEDVTIKRASERDIAFVFQLYALYPYMSVYDNITFPLVTQRTSKKVIAEEAEKVIKLLQIGHILKKKPKELSGGDMQRVALGRAIIRRPKAFLLDEPIGTLDAKFREEMRIELKRLHVDIGATTAYVTHDQIEAMSMGDRIAIMNLGVLQQIGTPDEIYNKPKNLFVANFIGSPGMNFINCKAIRTDGDIQLNISSNNQNVNINNDTKDIILQKNYLNKELILGVRPEDIMFSLESKPSYIKIEVYLIESTGSYNIIDVKLEGMESIRVRTISTIEPRIGDNAYINFDYDRISFFDKETENAIF